MRDAFDVPVNAYVQVAPGSIQITWELVQTESSLSRHLPATISQLEHKPSSPEMCKHFLKVKVSWPSFPFACLGAAESLVDVGQGSVPVHLMLARSALAPKAMSELTPLGKHMTG